MSLNSPVGVIPLPVASGGTGAATLTSGGVLIGAGTGAVTATVTPSGLTSVTSTSFITSSATIGTTITDNSIAVTGSTANTDLLISGKGTGGVIQSRGLVGSDLTIECTNTDNTNGASRAGVELAVGGDTAGDPYVNFLVSGAGVYTMGIDNSATDNFVLSKNAALGTSNVLSFDNSTNAATFAAGITATTGNIESTAGTVSGLFSSFSGLNETFSQEPILQAIANTGAAPVTTTNVANIMGIQGGYNMYSFNIGTQDIIAPRMTTTGLLTSCDLTAADGKEYNFGVNANNKFAFTIGTSPAFFIQLQVNAADIGGLDPFLVGFRRQEANNVAYTAYTDMAAIGARATTAADVCVITTVLNAGAFTYTNTTDAWTDGTTKTFRVNVSAAGVVTYLINGVAPTVTAAFTFDNTDVVMPFIHHIFGAATPGAINWISLQIGFQ